MQNNEQHELILPSRRITTKDSSLYTNKTRIFNQVSRKILDVIHAKTIRTFLQKNIFPTTFFLRSIYTNCVTFIRLHHDYYYVRTASQLNRFYPQNIAKISRPNPQRTRVTKIRKHR